MTLHTLLLTDAPLVQRVARTLAHTLWQGIAAAAVLRLAFGMVRHSARLRYAMACMAMASVAVAAAVTFVRIGETSTTPTIGSAAAMTAPLSFPAVPVAAPLQTHDGLANWRSATSLIVLMWAVGVSAQAAWHLLGWTRVRRLGREPPLADPRWSAALRSMTHRVGVRRAVRLLGSTRVDVPVVLGILRPAIVVPLSLVSELPAEHIEALLAHELAHVRRHDYLFNLIQCGVETVFFYHPAVWWISTQVGREREHCCDDAAASTIRSRSAVAAALVSLEAHRGPRLAVAATGSPAVERVRRLLAAPSPRRGAAGPAFAIAAAATAIVLGVHVARPARAQTRPALPATPRAVGPTTGAAGGISSAGEVLGILRRERSAAADRLRDLRAQGAGDGNPNVRRLADDVAVLDQRIGDVTVTADVPAPLAADPGQPDDDHASDARMQVLLAEQSTLVSVIEQLRDSIQDRHLMPASDAAATARAKIDFDQQKLDQIRAGIGERLQQLRRADDARKDAQRYVGEVYVGGDIARPGVYSITGPHRIAASRMVISAGDVNVEHGVMAWVTVTRREGGRQTTPVKHVPFAALLDGTAPDPDLQAGDVVRVSVTPP